jgi:hypothetical protein
MSLVENLTYIGDMRYAYKTSDGIPEGKIPFERVGIDERIQLKWILNKYCVIM